MAFALRFMYGSRHNLSILGQFDAVVSWIYTWGEGALKSSTMLKQIPVARHEEVPGQMKRWNRAGGKALKGLARRREAEAALDQLCWDGVRGARLTARG